MQRLRITFSRGEELKYITHLDLMRLWQRVLRRANIPLIYSQGFSPHPRISLAAPLAIGVTSSSELMDIYLERRLSPHFFIKSVKEQLPRGIDILEVAEVGVGLPSLQSQLRFAEYKVVLDADKKPKEVEAAICSLLESDSLPWQHTRDKEIRKYDLRTLIEDIWLIESSPPEFAVGMRLRCDSDGTGRPEQVVSALGFANPPKSIHRTKLILEKQLKAAAYR
ncbi:MAG: hypothetical protein A2Y59_03875 [Chloroflexi bacterium RBG_13_52_14]|nr:MAG: hypothetical protein A2Y59_03875 [Chloroflexi bacterium RBG_13_52_14]